ncbi:MAG: hypothetical protein OSB70_15440 [Myxococcota bacterium]|nr:hypothetical protein [Myxococcota bacterium]
MSLGNPTARTQHNSRARDHVGDLVRPQGLDPRGSPHPQIGRRIGFPRQQPRLFREVGFEVLDYLELQAPKGSPDKFGTPGQWAQTWPAEQAWKLRRL